MSDLAQTLTLEVCSLFPKETEKYKELIADCVEQILGSLPPGMSEEQYTQIVREHIQLVRNGKLG